MSFTFKEAEAFLEIVVLALQLHEEVAHEAQQGQILIDEMLSSNLVKHLKQVGYFGWIGESFCTQVIQHYNVLDFAIEAFYFSEVTSDDVVMLV